MNRLEIEKKLKKALDKERYTHTMGVMYTAASLAMRHGADMEQALYAGLLHDCAKCVPNREKLKLCKKHKIHVSLSEERNPFLLHAKLGEYLARKKYDVDDPDILDAIRYHTTGRPAMSLMEKVIYVADYIEPRRFKAPNLDRIRGLAFVDLDKAVCGIMSDTLDYLKKTPENIDKTTEEACLYYRELHEHTYLSNDSQE